MSIFESNQKFDWALNKGMFDESIFEKKKLMEFTNIKKVYGFIKNEMGISFQGNKKYEFLSKIDATELEQIKRFKELYNKKLKGFETAVILPKHKWGRVIPANNYLSLSIFRRQTRHSFCQGIYKDIDMVNAQPTIVYEIAKMNNVHCESLAKYISNPTKYREEIMLHHNCSKKYAKQLPITLMMGGTYDSWIYECDILTNIEKSQKLPKILDIEKELIAIKEIVYLKNQHIKKNVLKHDPKKWKDETESKRGVMGLWCQSVEKLLQETAIKYLVDSKDFKLEHIVPCQDGFMIIENLWYEDILQDCKDAIKTKFNININFINKPFDEAIEIPEFEDDKPVYEWEDLLSAKMLSNRFLNEYGDYVVKSKNSVFVYYGEKWYDETESKKQHKLTRYISENLYSTIKEEIDSDISLNEKDKIKILKLLRSNTSASGKMNDVIRHILSKVKENEVEFNSYPFLIGFENGVYDLLKDEFRNYRFDDFMTLSTKYDYVQPDFTNEETVKVREELVNIIEMIQPDPDTRLLYLQTLASGLDGRPYQKLFLFNGQGGNGKGLTGSLMDITLGNYYHQPSNGILRDLEKSNAPSPDMINLKNKRYINFKEVDGCLRLAILRNLTGGGKFSGRFLNQNPETFFMSSTYVMEFNASPDVDGKPEKADYRRLVDILFPVNFTDDPNKIDKEIGGRLFKKANSYYETQEFLEKVKHVFLDLLLGVYRQYKNGKNGIEFTIPQSVRDRTEVFIGNLNLFQKIFNRYWIYAEIEKKNGDFDKNDAKLKTQKVADIWDTIRFSEDYNSLTFRDKRKYGREEFYKWIEESYVISGNSKTGKLVVGLIKKPEDSIDFIKDDSDANNNAESDAESDTGMIEEIKEKEVPKPMKKMIKKKVSNYPSEARAGVEEEKR